MIVNKKYDQFFGLTYISTGKDTSGKYFISQTAVPAGDLGPPVHTHSSEDEGFYIVRGKITFIVNDRKVSLSTGNFINIQKGEKHTWRNDSNSDAEMIIIFSPAGIEKMFIELDYAMKKGISNFNKSLIKIGLKYGTNFLIDK
jgi:quercetin dioxygenase-like cupin family protein